MTNSKFILTLILSMLISLTAVAQRHHGRKFNAEQHRQERADFFIKEMNLTAKEQADFIPLMQEYINARFEANREARNAARELRRKANKTSADYQKVIDQMLAQKEKEVNLQKEYYKKFGQVLPPEKVLKYHSSEMKFMGEVVRNHRMCSEKDKETQEKRR